MERFVRMLFFYFLPSTFYRSKIRLAAGDRKNSPTFPFPLSLFLCFLSPFNFSLSIGTEEPAIV